MSPEPTVRDDLDPEPGTFDPDDPLAGVDDPYDLGELDDLDGFGEDVLADADLAGDDLPDRDADGAEPVLLVWPAAEFQELDLSWSEVLEPLAVGSWDDYRRQVQVTVTGWDRPEPLLLVRATADGFAEWLADRGVDPAGPDLMAMADRYARHLAGLGTAVELPLAPADPCWCGSGLGYADCCQLFGGD